MTVKDALRERIDRMSEEEAAELLAQMEWEATDFEELTPEELAAVDESQAEYDKGMYVDGEALFRRLGH